MMEGTVSVPPYRTCAYSDDDVLPVRWLSHSGKPQRRGWNPRECLDCHWAFSMKIVVFEYDVEIVTTLSISYDVCRRPRRGAPAADRWLQKNSLPAVPRRGPEVGFLHIKDDFHGLGVNRIDSCLFLQSIFFMIIHWLNQFLKINSPFLFWIILLILLCNFVSICIWM